MTDPVPAPVVTTDVKVVSIWAHPMVILTTATAIIPVIIAALVQLHDIPGLPTNVLAWIASAVAVLTTILTILRNLGLLGQMATTPSAAAKLMKDN